MPGRLHPKGVSKEAALQTVTLGTKGIYDAIRYYEETGDAEGASQMLGGVALSNGTSAYLMRGTPLGTTPLKQLPGKVLRTARGALKAGRGTLRCVTRKGARTLGASELDLATEVGKGLG